MKKKYVNIIIIIAIIVLIVELGFIVINKVKKNYRYSKLEDITFVDDKINIYVFWGDGCPHCENLLTMLEDTKKDYGKYYNIYGFEVWENEDNGKIMDYFLEKFDKEVGNRSVPFYIIGDESFSGYSEKMKEEVLNTIIKEYEERHNNQSFEDVKDIVLE